MLKFPAKWRIAPPADSSLITATIPSDAREEFFGIAKAIVANAPNQKEAFEEFKRSFALARGVRYGPSSSRDYAEYDLGQALEEASSNAPKFLEAFHDGWLAVSKLWPQLTEVDSELLNAIANKHSIGYIVDPPELRLREDVHVIPSHRRRFLKPPTGSSENRSSAQNNSFVRDVVVKRYRIRCGYSNRFRPPFRTSGRTDTTSIRSFRACANRTTAPASIVSCTGWRSCTACCPLRKQVAFDMGRTSRRTRSNHMRRSCSVI